MSQQRRNYELDVVIDEDVPAPNRFRALRIRAYALGTRFSSEYAATSTLRTYKIAITGRSDELNTIEGEYPELRRVEESPNAPLALNHLRPLP